MSRLTLALLLSFPAFGYAQTTVTNTFQNGTTADANEVNENFNDLTNAINSIVQPPTNCSIRLNVKNKKTARDKEKKLRNIKQSLKR